VILVPKPDGKMRCCVDCWQFNEVTVRDVYPLPRMEDCIDFLGDAKAFSTLDCNSGHWKIPVADKGPQGQALLLVPRGGGVFGPYRGPGAVEGAGQECPRA